MTYYVQVYRSTDLNSPPISGQIGSSIVVLNQCLVDGYGWSGMSITGITRSGSTATATVSAADGLKLKTGQILTIAGVTGPGVGDPALYNGTFTITVASTTTFTYTMSGTPTGSASGTMSCDNFLRINSITHGGVGNLTAFVTTLNNNLTLLSGNWLTISGCTGTGASQFNGTFQINVTGANTFTYQMSSDPGADASGNPVYYKAGLQWTRPFAAGTNSQTYLSQATIGALGETYVPQYLQVIDNGVVSAIQSEVYGAEKMYADQTISLGQFPTTAQRTNPPFKKATAAGATIREWTLWGDEKTFYFSVINGDFAWPNHDGNLSFGYFIPSKNGDKFNTFIAMNSGTSTNKYVGLHHATMFGQPRTVETFDFYIARSYTQFGTSVSSTMTLPYGSSNAPGIGGMVLGNNINNFLSYPNPADNGFYIQPIFISDTSGNIRGRMPGIFCSLHQNPLNNYDTVTNVVGLSGVTLLNIVIVNYSAVGQMLVDMFGPWV